MSSFLRQQGWTALKCKDDWNDIFKLFNRRTEEELLDDLTKYAEFFSQSSRKWLKRGSPVVVPVDKAKGLIRGACELSLVIKMANVC